MASPPVVGGAGGGQGVGFVQKQHAPQGGLEDLLGLQGGLPHVPRHQAGPVHLHQLALGEDADGPVQLADEPGHGGLSRAGVAHEHQVEGQGQGGQTGRLPEAADLHEVHQAVDLRLHPLQPHQSIQLGQEFLQGGLGVGGLCLLGAGCGRGRFVLTGRRCGVRGRRRGPGGRAGKSSGGGGGVPPAGRPAATG